MYLLYFCTFVPFMLTLLGLDSTWAYRPSLLGRRSQFPSHGPAPLIPSFSLMYPKQQQQQSPAMPHDHVRWHLCASHSLLRNQRVTARTNANLGQTREPSG
ncbi:hypothetical protein SODALDRAFT_129507 [Sodiomyces alkalinus F11]|uniref:Secreted protein n=1 Tax=Sodiomyces alkalinus (strain CBS 110278 / VKM F-3762 / F11) TaxID=1314773 RepID=A0A3N2Q4Z8_SODAK|nr:hypothetical protein SODALDRAFT_129507 [Sodiomyces alkalinus F11]ROT41776.1 hypothetical protein SODALDRAFT_129507 [Sodiomyces alkalinus F11]